jgi:hypothetical protein
MKYKIFFLALVFIAMPGCVAHLPAPDVVVVHDRPVVRVSPPTVRIYHHHHHPRPVVRTVHHHHHRPVIRSTHHHHRRTVVRDRHRGRTHRHHRRHHHRRTRR